MTDFNCAVSIGDLVQACCDLRALDAVSIMQVAAALGIDVKVDIQDAVADGGSTPKPQAVTSASIEPPHSGAEASSPAPSLPQEPAPPALPDLPFSAQPEATALASIEPVEFDMEALEQPERRRLVSPITAYEGIEEFPGSIRSMPMPTLFDPNLQSKLLLEVVATSLPSRRLDVRGLTDLLARGRWPVRLPFLTTRLASLGCQFLVDIGAGMEPFALDHILLLKVVRDIIGSERLVARFFRDCPIFGVEDPETLDVEEWNPPARKCPIIVVTDLGLSAPPFLSGSTLDDWIAFADRVVGNRSPLTFLVPCPRSRIPKPLCRRATTITWDRPTTIADVRRFRARGTPGGYK